MHQTSIPAAITERVIARCGRAHPFDDLAPARTALVVIDLQRGFMDPDVAHAFIPAARGIVPNVNRLAAATRAAGGLVVWVQNTCTAADVASWSCLHDGLLGPAARAKRIAAMAPGSAGHALWPELAVRSGDAVVAKHRYSAFIQGSSELPGLLRGRGVDTVLIAGAATNVCCEASARDAMMLDFRTVMVGDANAADGDAAHNAALATFYQYFGDVGDTDWLIGLLAAGRAHGAPNAAP